MTNSKDEDDKTMTDYLMTVTADTAILIQSIADCQQKARVEYPDIKTSFQTRCHYTRLQLIKFKSMFMELTDSIEDDDKEDLHFQPYEEPDSDDDKPLTDLVSNKKEFGSSKYSPIELE